MREERLEPAWGKGTGDGELREEGAESLRPCNDLAVEQMQQCNGGGLSGVLVCQGRRRWWNWLECLPQHHAAGG